MKHLHFLHYVFYLPMPLRKLPVAIGLYRLNRGIRIILTQRQIWTTWAPYPTSGISALMRWGGREKGLHVLVL